MVEALRRGDQVVTQGGIVGKLYLMFGEDDQERNAMLVDAFGDRTCSWRGFAAAAFDGLYGSNNPYPQAAAHKIENLSERDSQAMRMLVQSEWYQARWGDTVQLDPSNNSKLKFANLRGGFRIASAMSSLTGIRASRVLIDDPHSVDSALSEATRASEVQTFLEAVPTRVISPKRSAIVVIMQRLHEDDVSGTILSRQMGYDHLMLPMYYDPQRARTTAIGYDDPRTEDGEPLFPERYPPEVLADGARVMMPEIATADAPPGALILFRMMPRAIAKHVGILTGPDTFLHAYERLGVIEEPLTAAWRRRIAFAFLFPQR